MIKDLVMKNRSYRGFDKARKLTREELEYFVELARLCPSSVNVQPLKYYLVHEDEQVRKVQQTTKWARALPHLNLPFEGTEPTAFIIICQDLNIGDSIARYQKDVGIVAQTMLLGAVEMGLGGCMIGNYSSDDLRLALNLDEKIQPVLIVAFGKPNENIEIVDIDDSGDTKYYRDDENNHYVPKRKKDVLIINRT